MSRITLTLAVLVMSAVATQARANEHNAVFLGAGRADLAANIHQVHDWHGYYGHHHGYYGYYGPTLAAPPVVVVPTYPTYPAYPAYTMPPVAPTYAVPPAYYYPRPGVRLGIGCRGLSLGIGL
ncbi:MAG: hypothetical protein ABSG68_05835 [Thermoguttaceae bacterium]